VDGGGGTGRMVRSVPPPPSTSVTSSFGGEAQLNDQEKDLLRQLQEELAKRERAEAEDSASWRTDRAGRHHDREATWATGTAGPQSARIVNGAPPSAGGESHRFPPGA